MRRALASAGLLGAVALGPAVLLAPTAMADTPGSTMLATESVDDDDSDDSGKWGLAGLTGLFGLFGYKKYKEYRDTRSTHNDPGGATRR